MRLNVLLVLQGPNAGAWAVVRNLAQGLAGRANVFVGISYKRGTCEAARAEAARLPCPVFEYELPADFPGAYGLLVPPTPRWVRRIERASGPECPTVVHLHNGLGIGALALRPWFRRNARRCAITFHGIPPRDDPAVRPGRDLRLGLHACLVRRIHRLGATMVAVSHASALQMADRYGLPAGAFRVVPNGVPGPVGAAKKTPGVVSPNGPKGAAQERPLGSFSPPLLTVAFIGTLNDVKGWDLAAEAVSRLAGAGRRVHLVIAGDGPRRPEVEAAARRRPGLITYLGRLPSGEIGALLDEVDVLALPSKSEGMPMVILEAMARGVPCVATRVAGIPECAEGCGLLLEERSADAVAAALARLADDAALRYALGRRAAEKHRQAFSFEAMAEHYMAIYRKLAEAEPAPPGLKELSCA